MTDRPKKITGVKKEHQIDEDKVLVKSAKIASSKAIRSSIALGLTVKSIQGNQIIEVNSDKTTKVLREVVKSEMDISKLKKGLVLKRNVKK